MKKNYQLDKLAKLYETKVHAYVTWESKRLLSKHWFIESSVFHGNVSHLFYGLVKSTVIWGPQ